MCPIYQNRTHHVIRLGAGSYNIVRNGSLELDHEVRFYSDEEAARWACEMADRLEKSPRFAPRLTALEQRAIKLHDHGILPATIAFRLGLPKPEVDYLIKRYN